MTIYLDGQRRNDLLKKMATREQIFDLLCNDQMTLIDAIGLDFDDVQLSCPIALFSPSLIILVRSGLEHKIPKEITVIIDKEELYIDFEVQVEEDWEAGW